MTGGVVKGFLFKLMLASTDEKNIVCDSTSARVMLASKARTRTLARNKQLQSSRESIEYCFVHVLEEREGGEGERGGGRCRLPTLPKALTFTQGINFS